MNPATFLLTLARAWWAERRRPSPEQAARNLAVAWDAVEAFDEDQRWDEMRDMAQR